MTQTEKNQLQEFLLNAFLFALFRKTQITLKDGQRCLTSHGRFAAGLVIFGRYSGRYFT